MNDAPVSYLLRQAGIKTDNNLMDFYDLVGKMFQTLEEEKSHKLAFI